MVNVNFSGPVEATIAVFLGFLPLYDNSLIATYITGSSMNIERPITNSLDFICVVVFIDVEVQGFCDEGG
jgi:hypothetical protein